MSAQMLQSLGPMLSGGGQTPNVAGMAPDMGAIAQQYGGGQAAAAAPSSLAPNLDPMQIIAQNMQAQNSPLNITAQGLGQVGQAYIDKNVEPRHQMPLAPAFGMATSQMGALPFGSSQSPLLAYLSMLGSKG